MPLTHTLVHTRLSKQDSPVGHFLPFTPKSCKLAIPRSRAICPCPGCPALYTTQPSLACTMKEIPTQNLTLVEPKVNGKRLVNGHVDVCVGGQQSALSWCSPGLEDSCCCTLGLRSKKLWYLNRRRRTSFSFTSCSIRDLDESSHLRTQGQEGDTVMQGTCCDFSLTRGHAHTHTRLLELMRKFTHNPTKRGNV